MFLLVPAHPGFPGQIPQSRKMVVCVCVLSGTIRVSRYQKGKTNLDLLEQETVSGSGISWAICKSAPRPNNLSVQQFNYMSGGVLAWLSVWGKVQIWIWLSTCHCHSLSVALVKYRLVLPFCYQLTRVVLDKGPLNGCCCFIVSI